jgi:hypothetical protein
MDCVETTKSKRREGQAWCGDRGSGSQAHDGGECDEKQGWQDVRDDLVLDDVMGGTECEQSLRIIGTKSLMELDKVLTTSVRLKSKINRILP